MTFHVQNLTLVCTKIYKTNWGWTSVQRSKYNNVICTTPADWHSSAVGYEVDLQVITGAVDVLGGCFYDHYYYYYSSIYVHVGFLFKGNTARFADPYLYYIKPFHHHQPFSDIRVYKYTGTYVRINLYYVYPTLRK